MMPGMARHTLPAATTRSHNTLRHPVPTCTRGSLNTAWAGCVALQLHPRSGRQHRHAIAAAAPQADDLTATWGASCGSGRRYPLPPGWRQLQADTSTSSSSIGAAQAPVVCSSSSSSWHPLLQRCWLGLGALTIFLALPASSFNPRPAAAAAAATTPHTTSTTAAASPSGSSTHRPAGSQPPAAAAGGSGGGTCTGADSVGDTAATSSSSSSDRWGWTQVADIATTTSSGSREGLAESTPLRDPAPLPPPPIPPPPPPAPSLPPPLPTPPPPPPTISTPDGLLPHERTAALLFAANVPSVVNISHPRSSQNFYTLDITRMAVGQGSGFIWDRAGHVVTNYHLIKGAAEVKVTLSDYTSCTARVVGADASRDLALLRLALPRSRLEALRPAVLGSSAGLQIGQAVYALGNPFGLDATLSVGVVSGLGREAPAGLFPLKGLIQTDAAINPGNSGGPLLNSQGQVVGLNVSLSDANSRAGFPGVGFALPVDGLKGLVGQLMATGRVRRPALGVALAPKQVLQQLGVEGVLVLEVPAGSPAAAAGLRPTSRDVFGDLVLGDIIVGLDTRPVGGAGDLVAALDGRKPGDKVRCDVLRDGKRLSMTVTLTERGPGTAEE